MFVTVNVIQNGWPTFRVAGNATSDTSSAAGGRINSAFDSAGPLVTANPVFASVAVAVVVKLTVPARLPV